MNEDEASLRSAIKAGACLNSPIDLDDTTVAGLLHSLLLVQFRTSLGSYFLYSRFIPPRSS